MIHLSSSNWFGLLFSNQNWIDSENIPQNSDFLMDFDNFWSLFECHSILAEKQQTKQTNYSFLSSSASLDTRHPPGLYNRKKFWQEIPVWNVFSQFWLTYESHLYSVLSTSWSRWKYQNIWWYVISLSLSFIFFTLDFVSEAIY